MSDNEQEIKRLKRLVEAYERLTAFSHRELLDASQTIAAQEQVSALSAEEIRLLKNEIEELQRGTPSTQALIKRILNEDDKNETLIMQELEEIRRHSGESFYVDIFRVLLHHDFAPADASRHWAEIMEHGKKMAENLGRNVGFRVAMIDYFINANKVLKNPMVIEISIFDEVVKSSLQDELTLIFNRRYFDKSIVREINRARRHESVLSLFLFDVDDFKNLNDTLGHAAGDGVLREIGIMMRSMFRNEDIPCRFGGEEFAVILPETKSDAAIKVAERFAKQLREKSIDGQKVTISGGIAQFPDDAQDPGTLFLQADRALYRAKIDGKNRIFTVPPREDR